ncbi:GD17552 [Drosophila simulans]|uniref:GD17552 n=1 Tax=Drosophila simulans TaxID=7240 RepID=B4R449_DROSI|nr:GD17552 [Drosophila simulans]
MCQGRNLRTSTALVNLLAKCTKSTNGQAAVLAKDEESENRGNLVPQKQRAKRQNKQQQHTQQYTQMLQEQQQHQEQHNQRQQQGRQIEQMAMETNEEAAAAKEHEHQTKPTDSECKGKHKHQRNRNNVAGVQQHVLRLQLELQLLLVRPVADCLAAGAAAPATWRRSHGQISSAKGPARELLLTEMGGGGVGVGAGGSSGGAAHPAGGGPGTGLAGGDGEGAAGIECPSFDNTACPCYKFEDGLFLECPGTTAISLRSTLERISAPIHSLSIYDFDRSVTSLSQDVFQPGVHIRHLQFSHSHLEALKDNSLRNVRSSLESLSIVNGKLTQPSGVGHLERASAAIQGQNVLEALAIAVGKKTTAWSACKGGVAAGRGSL